MGVPRSPDSDGWHPVWIWRALPPRHLLRQFFADLCYPLAARMQACEAKHRAIRGRVLPNDAAEAPQPCLQIACLSKLFRRITICDKAHIFAVRYLFLWRQPIKDGLPSISAAAGGAAAGVALQAGAVAHHGEVHALGAGLALICLLYTSDAADE